jgi:hypothetical protein
MQLMQDGCIMSQDRRLQQLQDEVEDMMLQRAHPNTSPREYCDITRDIMYRLRQAAVLNGWLPHITVAQVHADYWKQVADDEEFEREWDEAEALDREWTQLQEDQQ